MWSDSGDSGKLRLIGVKLPPSYRFFGFTRLWISGPRDFSVAAAAAPAGDQSLPKGCLTCGNVSYTVFTYTEY